MPSHPPSEQKQKNAPDGTLLTALLQEVPSSSLKKKETQQTKQSDSLDGTLLSALLQEVQQRSPATPNTSKKQTQDLILTHPKIQEVAFSLLSAGVFRGRRHLRTVLQLGVTAIRDWVKDESNDCGSLERIVLCAYQPKEVDTLLEVCVQELL